MLETNQNNNATTITDNPHLNVLIIGVGLIGSSLAGALIRHGDYRVAVYDQNHDASAIAVAQHLAHHRWTDLAQGVAEADIIVLAVPVLAFQAVLKQLSHCDLGKTIITDTGSVKRCFVEAVRHIFGHIPSTCVPGHPIAGSENSGVQAADPQLYCDHQVILTPLEHTDWCAVQRVQALWEASGAQVECMDLEEHDRILAMTSHLPHFLAFALMDMLDSDTQSADIFRYSAGGLRDFTRIAGSNPTVWQNIFSANQEAIVPALERFITQLQRLKEAVIEPDHDQILSTLHRAQAAQARLSSRLKKKL